MLMKCCQNSPMRSSQYTNEGPLKFMAQKPSILRKLKSSQIEDDSDVSVELESFFFQTQSLKFDCDEMKLERGIRNFSPNKNDLSFLRSPSDQQPDKCLPLAGDFEDFLDQDTDSETTRIEFFRQTRLREPLQNINTNFSFNQSMELLTSKVK